MNSFRFLLTFTLLQTSIAATTADPPVKLLRLGVIDDSGSMIGERITTVRNEWLNLARQLPPSPENPIVLITFGSSASAPQVYVDLPTFEAAIGQLSGSSGGTNIAAGLNQGIAHLKAHTNALDVWVLLYSDGEDPNQAGILAAEAELDSIFADRQQQGLPQTVFLKRWGNSNADLLNRIRSHGRANVLDAGELTVRPITFHPKIDLLGVEWNPDDPLKLDVRYAPTLEVQGAVDGLTLPNLKLEVTTEKATGDASIDLHPGAPAIPRKVTIPISVQDRRAGNLEIPFVLNPPKDIVADDMKILPLLAASKIDLSIELPEDRFTYTMLFTAKPQTATWNDTQAKRFRTPLQLQCDVSCREGASERPGDVEFVPAAGTVIVSGPTSVELPASGLVTVDLVIETAVLNPTDPPDKWRSSYEFAVRPVRTRPHVTFDPPEVSVTGDLQIPAPIQTPINVRVIGVSSAEWIDLAKGHARFHVETEFDVQGPISPLSQINLVTTGSLLTVDTQPGVLQKGIQRVTLVVTAVLPPAPKTQTMESLVVPPVSDGVIQYKAGPPFQYTVTGPIALRLGVAQRGHTVRELRISVADNDREAQLPFEPIVLGMKPSAAGSDLEVRLDAKSEPLKFPIPDSYRVFRKSRLAVPVQLQKSPSFFKDSVLTGTLHVEPLHGNTAVLGSELPLIVVVAAPFKRLLWQLALTLSSIVATVVVIRLYLTLRRAD